MKKKRLGSAISPLLPTRPRAPSVMESGVSYDEFFKYKRKRNMCVCVYKIIHKNNKEAKITKKIKIMCV